MHKKTLHRLISVLAALALGLSLLTGCGTKSAEALEKQEDAQTIQVYLWTNNLYETYAAYIQSQLPDVNIEFIVGNNDLDFYKFLQENGGLPDIITCCRFSLHDAAPLKDSLMNLALTNEAGAVYNTYLNSFKNEDGSVNWLPVCADAHGFVVNRSLFEQYDIPLPTDYASFVAACQAFEKVGIRGFTADYTYDYTCMETLQGLSAAELTTMEGRKWRTAYSDPANTTRVGLDDTVWPGAFERMAQFIQDTHLTAGRSYGELRRCDREVSERESCNVLWQLCRGQDVSGRGHRHDLFALLQPERRKVADDHPVFPGRVEP